MDETGGGRVYRLDDGSGWAAADGAGWLPGVFPDEAAARAALAESKIPMIVVPADTETVAIIEQALRDPGHYLADRHRALAGDERMATAIAMALMYHSEGLGLTCGLPGCMPDPITAEVLAELDGEA